MSKQFGHMFRTSAVAWSEMQLGVSKVFNHGVANKGADIPPRLIPFAAPPIAGASRAIDVVPEVPSPKQTILVVETIQLMREGLAAILRSGWPEFDIRLAEDSSGLNGAMDCEPALIVMSLRDEPSSPALPKWADLLHEKFSRTPVLLISDQDDPYRALCALRSGFAGYFPSTLSANMLMAAISLVLAGGKFCPSCVIHCGFPERERVFGR